LRSRSSSLTYYAARRTKTASEFNSAGRSITGFQNGWAVAGDYMSAASFFGISGLIAFFGYDGFMYSVGWLVAYLTVLLLVAEPLRNTGKFTMADVLAFRLHNKTVRGVAAFSTLAVSLFYMIAQVVGAGSLVSLLIPQLSLELAIVIVGVLMLVYVVFGGMLATTWVQIVKAVLLMSGTILLSLLVLAHHHFSMVEFFDAIANVKGTIKDAAGTVIATKNFTEPGLRYNGQWGALDLISLGIALVFGTAGLPHILVRGRLGDDPHRCVLHHDHVLGFGAATLVGKANIGVHVSGAKATAFIAAHPAEADKLNEQLNN
jgi:cation/acetate symporter